MVEQRQLAFLPVAVCGRWLRHGLAPVGGNSPVRTEPQLRIDWLSQREVDWPCVAGHNHPQHSIYPAALVLLTFCAAREPLDIQIISVEDTKP
jgi:hypothetical protein